MLLPSVIAVYSTRDQTAQKKRHKGPKQKGYVELLLSVSTGVGLSLLVRRFAAWLLLY
jgi:hypothetical protein